jgi:hypothetical protein
MRSLKFALTLPGVDDKKLKNVNVSHSGTEGSGIT